MTRSAEWDTWVAQARAVDIANVVAARGGLGLKRRKTELIGACPHCGGEDRFSVATRPDKQVFNCRGCGAKGDVIDLVKFIDGCDFEHAVETLTREAKPNGHDKLGKAIAEYSYTNEAGELLFQVCRFDPKAFRQRRPDGHGHWTWNVTGVRMVSYRLPELIEAIASEHPVLVVEGERDVRTAVQLGLVATTNPGGAGKWRAEYNAHFANADVIIVPDRDAAGAAHALNVATQLHKVAKRVRMVSLPNGKDLTAWVQRGGTREQFDRLVENALEEKGSDQSSERTLNAAEVAAAFTFLGDEPAKAPRELIKKLLPAEGVAITGGQPSAGKTFIEIHKAVCLGTGHPFFGHAIVERVGTVFVAAEGRPLLPNRFAAALAKAAITQNLPIAWINQLPDLTSAEGFKLFIAQLKAMDQRFQKGFGMRLGQVAIDTVGVCFSMKSEDDNAEATKVCNVLRAISNETKAVTTAVHHYGKNPESGLRGASAWRGCADIIVGVLADIDQLSGRASSRELACVKARDGEQGPISPFDLEFVELGLDADGEIYGSCCVAPREGASRFEKTAKPSKGQRIIQDAITETLDSLGKIIVPRAGMPPVKAVKVNELRAEFDRRYVIDEADPLKAAHTKRMAFKRALDRLPPAHFGAGATEGADWIWKIS